MRIIIVLTLFLVFFSCSHKEKQVNNDVKPEKKVHYFILQSPLRRSKSSDLISYRYSYLGKGIENPIDSIWYGFDLKHYIGRDTFFIKTGAYIDSIDYYDASFFDDNKRVARFFEKRFSWEPDTLEIYMIERRRGSDSLVFKKVNRFVMPYL